MPMIDKIHPSDWREGEWVEKAQMAIKLWKKLIKVIHMCSYRPKFKKKKKTLLGMKPNDRLDPKVKRYCSNFSFIRQKKRSYHVAFWHRANLKKIWDYNARSYAFAEFLAVFIWNLSFMLRFPIGNLMTFSSREVGKLSWFQYTSPKGKRSDIIIKIENIPIVLSRCFS